MNKFLVILFSFVFFCSCSIIKKSKSSYSKKTDSVTVVSAVETAVQKSESAKSIEKDVEKVSNIKLTLIYDTGKVYINTVPRATTAKTNFDKIIESLVNERLRKIEVEADVNLKDRSKIFENITKNDSTSKTDSSSTVVKKEEEQKTLNKEVKPGFWTSLFSSPWLWGILIIIAIIFFLKYKPTVMNFLKKLFPFVLILFLFSCNNPDGKIYGTSSEPAGWDMGQQTFTDYVYVQPTWGQAFYYNLKSGGTWELVVGSIFFFAFAIWFVLLTKKVIKVTLLNLLGMFLLLAASLAFVFTQPSTIRWNNNIKIEKQVYEQKKDNLPVMWDDLYYQKRIVGTSGK